MELIKNQLNNKKAIQLFIQFINLSMKRKFIELTFKISPMNTGYFKQRWIGREIAEGKSKTVEPRARISTKQFANAI